MAAPDAAELARQTKLPVGVVDAALAELVSAGRAVRSSRGSSRRDDDGAVVLLGCGYSWEVALRRVLDAV